MMWRITVQVAPLCPLCGFGTGTTYSLPPILVQKVPVPVSSQKVSALKVRYRHKRYWTLKVSGTKGTYRIQKVPVGRYDVHLEERWIRPYNTNKVQYRYPLRQLPGIFLLRQLCIYMGPFTSTTGYIFIASTMHLHGDISIQCIKNSGCVWF